MAERPSGRPVSDKGQGLLSSEQPVGSYLRLIAENDLALQGLPDIWVLSSKGGWGPHIGVGGRNRSSAGALRPCQADAGDIRLMFQAMVTRLHSPRAPARPRSEN